MPRMAAMLGHELFLPTRCHLHRLRTSLGRKSTVLRPKRNGPSGPEIRCRPEQKPFIAVPGEIVQTLIAPLTGASQLKAECSAIN